MDLLHSNLLQLLCTLDCYSEFCCKNGSFTSFHRRKRHKEHFSVNLSFGDKVYCSYDKCNHISLFSAEELFWSCLKYMWVLQIRKRLLKCNSCNTCNAEHDAYQYQLCNWYLWIPVDNDAKMWVRNVLFSSYSPSLPQSMSGEDLVCIIFCYGFCHENEASGYSFPSEESEKGRSRNWIPQTIFRTLDGKLLILWMEIAEM